MPDQQHEQTEINAAVNVAVEKILHVAVLMRSAPRDDAMQARRQLYSAMDLADLTLKLRELRGDFAQVPGDRVGINPITAARASALLNMIGDLPQATDDLERSENEHMGSSAGEK